MPEDAGTGLFDNQSGSGYTSNQQDDAKYGSKRRLSIEEVAYYAISMFPTAGGIGVIYEGNAAIATAIAMAESGGDTRAHNSRPPDDSYGLWQINMIGALGPIRRVQFGLKNNDELFNPATNAQAARKIFDSSGWRAWSTYSNGAYKRYLSAAQNAVKNPVKPDSVQSGPTNTKNFITDAVDGFQSFIAEGALRVGGFIGGAGLIIMAVVLLGKKGVK